CLPAPCQTRGLGWAGTQRYWQFSICLLLQLSEDGPINIPGMGKYNAESSWICTYLHAAQNALSCSTKPPPTSIGPRHRS
ncbi:unnamed protein product, partial [Heterosigma akashiwo]